MEEHEHVPKTTLGPIIGITGKNSHASHKRCTRQDGVAKEIDYDTEKERFLLKQ